MSKKQAKTDKFSTYISDFCNLASGVKSEYEWHKAEVGRLEQLTQDYLHKLELENLDYRGRAKVATQLSKCRQQRRESKDMVEVLEPLVLFLDGEKGKGMFNMLREVLGKTRKIEAKMETRVYKNRVLQEEEVVDGE